MFDHDFMLETILQHLSWYPLMGLRDVYKLIYQGVMGSEHLIASPEGFIRYLDDEFETLLPDPSGRLLESIHPDKILYRINLCPYKSRQLTTDFLIPGLLETARSFSGDPVALRVAWNGFIQICKQGRLPGFDAGELHEFTAWLEELDYPAVHHSETYTQVYLPAYRLISAEFAHRLGLDDAG
jgi:hypothetical protein